MKYIDVTQGPKVRVNEETGTIIIMFPDNNITAPRLIEIAGMILNMFSEKLTKPELNGR